MSHIAERMQAVRERIARAAADAGRSPGEIRLLAVSKTFASGAIAEAAAAGQVAFGENYVQEAVAKIAALRHLPGLEWHMIGPLQANKTALAAENFSWVQSIDREKIAARLSSARPAGMPPLSVCVQVNISGEATKSGVAPAGAVALAATVAAMPGLRLRGLMGIAEPSTTAAIPRLQFRLLRELRDELRGRGLALDTLSMGMSADMEAAIAEGSTMVRIGSAIFGERHTEAA
ncbi:MAG: YggS family pyridoxal phosphate-dependent enzyme [Burkholderiales bacterium]|nr:YggS family pyridoxal phosphate-dependent enzyme [Burkholderiales bacterium]